MKSLIRFVCFAISFLIFQTSVSFSLEANFDVFEELIFEGQYEPALQELLALHRQYPHDIEVEQQLGFMHGSGLLAGGVNKCRATQHLERAYAQDRPYLRSALDYLWGGDWAAVAATAGNPLALVEIGDRLSAAESPGSPFLVFDQFRGIKDAYVYYISAEKLGYREASSKIEKLVLEYGTDMFEGLAPIQSFPPMPCLR